MMTTLLQFLFLVASVSCTLLFPFGLWLIRCRALVPSPGRSDAIITLHAKSAYIVPKHVLDPPQPIQEPNGASERTTRAHIDALQEAMYGIDPFSAQHATGDGASNAPSIFGALPYPASASTDPPLHALVTLRFVPSSSGVGLSDATVLGPSDERVYRIKTVADPSSRGAITVLKAAAGHTIGLVEWRSHPTVEVQGLGGKQAVAQWLRLSADRRSRTLTHGGAHYSWAPVDRFLQLFAPGSSEWLARVTKHYNTVVLELTSRAVQLGLMDAAVVATMLLQSGRSID